MKNFRIVGLLVIAAVAPMALAGTASATITSPSGTAYTGTIEASSSNIALDSFVEIKCGKSTFAGRTVNGSTTFWLDTVTFTQCGADTWSILAKGSLRIASDGTFSWEGTELTTLSHRTVLGVPMTIHCTYTTAADPGTDIGKLTEGTTNITLTGATLSPAGTDPICGGSSSLLTGSYTITKPGPLTID